MRHTRHGIAFTLALLGFAGSASAVSETGDVVTRLVFPPNGVKLKAAPTVYAAVWLTSLEGSAHGTVPANTKYTLTQKNKQFLPHLLVVPVGSTVQFPNEDPFFHNVFSLFNGRRFDLGLYEAGTTRDVSFPREGVSYIFCNIHPEMSAVVLSLATNLYAVADAVGRFRVPDVAPGSYKLHVWIEGESEAELNRLSHTVQVAPGHTDLGAIVLRAQPLANGPHANKFSQPYPIERAPTY